MSKMPSNCLGDFVTIIMGQAPPGKDCNFEGKGTPFVKVGEFGLITPELREWTTNPLKLARRSDVLLCVVGATCGKINLGEDCAIGRSVAAIRPNETKLDQLYLYYFLSTFTARLRAGSLGAAQTVISKGMIQSLQIPLPTLPEQKRIVAILEEALEGIAAAIANAEKNLANARELFESYLDAIFTQKGEGWAEKKLGDVCQIKPPKNETKQNLGDSDLVSFVPMKDLGVRQKDLFLNKERPLSEVSGSYTYFADNDVLLAKITPCFENGKLGIARSLTNGIGFGSSEYIVFRSRGDIDPEYLFYFLSQDSFRNAGAKVMKGAVGHKRVPKEFIEEYLIPLPFLSEQKRIVEELDALRGETQHLETIYQQKLTSLAELKQTLLQKAFAGELTESLDTTKVIPFPKTIPGISTTDLHVGILAMAYQIHEDNPKHLDSFRHVKAEKISHMVEAYAGIDLGRKPVKDAAGPNDFPHLMKKVGPRARRAGFFNFKKGKGGKYSFEKYRRFNEIKEKTYDALGDDYEAVENIIKVMLPMDTQQAEIFTTVYAAWNNLLIRNEDVSDEAIVREARENWHEEKLGIERDKFFIAIKWMEDRNITPKGKGKLVEEKAT